MSAEPDETGVPATDASNDSPEAAWRQLDGATIWLPTCDAFFGALIPGAVASFFVSTWVVVTSVLYFVLVPVTLLSALRFFTLRYQITVDELVLHTGLIFRRQRRVPLDRIQDVDVQQGLLHRYLDLSKVSVSTAGSETEEVKLNVLSLDAANALKTAVAARHADLPEASDAGGVREECLVELSWRELAWGGLTSNLVASLGAVVGMLAYFSVVMNTVWSRWERNISDTVLGVAGNFLPQEGWSGLLVQIFIFDEWQFWPLKLLFIVLGLAYSIGKYTLRFYGFRLTRQHQILEKSHGLLHHQRATLASDRIQALKIEEGLLRRWCGLAAVRVDSAGDRNELDEKKHRDVLVPVASRAQAQMVAQETMPNLSVADPEWKRVSPKAVMRGTRKGWLLLAVAMVQSTIMWPWTFFVWLPAIPLIYLLNYQWYRHQGYHLDEQFLISRKGWLNRETLYLPIGNAQNVSVTQSPFDRRAHLATLAVDTAGQSNTGGGPVIRNLPIDEARRIYWHLASRAAVVQPVL